MLNFLLCQSVFLNFFCLFLFCFISVVRYEIADIMEIKSITILILSEESPNNLTLVDQVENKKILINSKFSVSCIANRPRIIRKCSPMAPGSIVKAI